MKWMNEIENNIRKLFKAFQKGEDWILIPIEGYETEYKQNQGGIQNE